MTKLSNKNILTAPLQRKSKLTEYVFKTERLEIEINKNYDFNRGCYIIRGCRSAGTFSYVTNRGE